MRTEKTQGERDDSIGQTVVGYLTSPQPPPKLIPLSKGKFAIVDSEDYNWVNQWKWCVDTNRPDSVFYAHRCVYRKGMKLIKIRMHRFIMDAKDGQQVDHI